MSMARTPIVVYGTGGHGRETALLIESMIAAGAPFQLLGYLTDDTTMHGVSVGNLPVLGGSAVLTARSGEMDVALGIGNASSRRALVQRIRADTRTFPVLVHPSVPYFDRVTMGEGTQVHAGTILTIDIVLGAFVILNRHVDVSHDCAVSDWATLAPAVTLAGGVQVGEGAIIGARATCIPFVRVGAWSTIGAGAVVTRNIPDNVTAVGIPARPLAPVS